MAAPLSVAGEGRDRGARHIVGDRYDLDARFLEGGRDRGVGGLGFDVQERGELLTDDPKIMGGLVNARWVRLILWPAALLVLFLNLVVLGQTLGLIQGH